MEFTFGNEQMQFHISFFSIALVLLVYVDAIYYVKKQQTRAELPAPPRKIALLLALLTVVSVILHELGHALVSIAFGTPIIEAGITAWGAYVRPLDSFLAVSPLQEILVSFAGPAVNFLIGILCAIIVKHYGESLFENSVQYLGYINVRLGRLNLFPIIILDGGKVLDGILRLFITNTEARDGLELIIGVGFLAYYLLLRGKKPVLEDKFETL